MLITNTRDAYTWLFLRITSAQDDINIMECLLQTVSELQDWRVALVCGVVMLNPLFWNAASRFEYRTRVLSRTMGGPKRGVTFLAACILSLNYLRTTVFHKTINNHSVCPKIDNEFFDALGWLFVLAGGFLVVASYYRLGFFGTFNGDYFGILLDERITGFPFNVVDDPMYWGSLLVYLGMATSHASILGLVLTACIGVSYGIAMYFEEPFTADIYANKKVQ